jgi:hypothetical protein
LGSDPLAAGWLLFSIRFLTWSWESNSKLRENHVH